MNRTIQISNGQRNRKVRKSKERWKGLTPPKFIMKRTTYYQMKKYMTKYDYNYEPEGNKVLS